MSQIFYIRTRTRSKCFWSVTVEIYIPLMSSRFQILRTRNLESSTWNPESTDCLRFTYMVQGGMEGGGGEGYCEETNQRLRRAAFACSLWQPFQDMTLRGHAAGCGMVFCPFALNCELYQGLDPIRGSMIWHARLASIYEQSQIGGLYLNLFKELLVTSIHFREP